MDNDSKRWFQFLTIAMLMWLTFLWMQPKQPPVSKTRPLPGARKETGATALRPTTGTQPQLTELSSVPGATQPLRAERINPPLPVDEPAREIVIQTDICKVTFSTAGAFPKRWQIVDPVFARACQQDVEDARHQTGVEKLKVGDPLPIDLIPNYPGLDPARDYPLMVVLKETNGRYLNDFNRRTYQVKGLTSSTLAATTQTLINLAASDSPREISFVSPESPEGLQLTKTYKFTPGSYLIQMRVTIANVRRDGGQNFDFSETSQSGLGIMWGPGIGATHYTDSWDLDMYDVASFDGNAIAYQSFGSWQKAARGEPQEHDFTGALKWGVLESRFFMAAIVPQGFTSPRVGALVKAQHVPERASQQEKMAPPLNLEIFSPGFLLRPGDSKTFEYQIFAGPKKRELLTGIDKKNNLELARVMFHNSWALIRWIALFMLTLLNWFQIHTGNYGVAIILLTLTMRLITQPFTHIAMKSQAKLMAEQKRIKPLIDSINEKYKDDPQKRSAETWKTYREHGVNPLGAMKGCVWMFIQLPIFFALYRLLQMAIDLRGEHFLWIQDLTAPDALFSFPFVLPFIGDKFNLLPILMALSQVFAQRLQTTNIEDPNQKMMMTMMPIMFVFILYNFASGLSLYWFVSNMWQITFQLLMNKRMKEEAERRAIHAFEERRKAFAGGPGAKTGPATPGWREKIVAYIEAKAKEAEELKKHKK